jgi:peptidoglycan-N-acetylglucosamine deacetylase
MTKNKNKPIAFISLDLDNLWSYMKIHGDDGWDDYPSYFDIFIPYVIELLDELQLKITFFIVGRDADNEENKPYLRMITEHGHGVGNHSYNHESWLHLYSVEKIKKEISEAEKAIINVTGEKPVGFRGPGFSWSYRVLEELNQQGYHYDSSTLPTFIGPLARMYYFWKSDLSKEERRDRKKLFGSFREGFRRLKPYKWNLKNRNKILEIPVTTIPFLKIPFHLSYLIYLSGYSIVLMRAYLFLAIFMCKISRTRPNFLLHPLDLISSDKITQLAFFPGMRIPSSRKAKVFKEVIVKLRKHYQLEGINNFYKLYNDMS